LTMSAATDDLYKELKAATKRANQRLVRLEQADEISFAYKHAKNDIRNVLGKDTGLPRFEVRKDMSYGELEKRLKYVNKFLNSASSTQKGMKAVIKKRDATLMARYGIKNVSELHRIFKEEDFDKVKELLPSTMVVQSISDAINEGMSADTIEEKLEILLLHSKDEYLIDKWHELLKQKPVELEPNPFEGVNEFGEDIE